MPSSSMELVSLIQKTLEKVERRSSHPSGRIVSLRLLIGIALLHQLLVETDDGVRHIRKQCVDCRGITLDEIREELEKDLRDTEIVVVPKRV